MKSQSTYDVVCEACVSHTLKYFRFDTLVVFDGYMSKQSSKEEAEQKRRASRAASRDILFDENIKTMTAHKEVFLAND